VLLAALEAFDVLLEELTGAPPAPSEDGAEGGRTPLYLDCLRDLDLDIGPALVAELAGSLPLMFEASRWWCGRSYALGNAILAEALAAGPDEQPLAPLVGPVLDALWQLPRHLQPEIPELRRRVAALLDGGDDETIAARGAAMFADHGPAWPFSVFQSADVQIAAADVEAIGAGDFLAVVGDFHPGNPLIQSLFSSRFPGPESFRELFHADVGRPIVQPILMRSPGMRLSARNIPDPTNPDDIHLLGPGITPIHVDYRALQISDLVVRGQDVLDPDGGFRAPLIDLFFLPMFVAAMRTFAPFPEVGPRITIGRTVLRRATWRARAVDRPAEAAGMVDWAAELGLPRRVFCLPAGEPKPVYVDFHSAALTRNLHRLLARAANANPDATVRFAEMLPGPDQCWLEHEHARYTSELRLVAVDQTRRGLGAVPIAS
jgi:hypothetical protein